MPVDSLKKENTEMRLKKKTHTHHAQEKSYKQGYNCGVVTVTKGTTYTTTLVTVFKTSCGLCHFAESLNLL